MAIIKNPRKQFNFDIQIAPLPINSFLVQQVKIGEVEIEQVMHGDTNHDVKTGGRINHPNITMEKIMTTSGADNFMWDWLKSVQDDVIGGGSVPTIYKRVMTVRELAEDGQSTLNTWVLTGVWPTKISGLDLNRQGSDNTIESIEFSVDNVEKL